MKVLLDTQIFIWMDSEPSRLSDDARSICEDPFHSLVLSVASAWEMQIKHQLGKLTLRLPLADVIGDQCDANGIQILPVTLNHVLALDRLPLHHRDPFDRLLVAQALSEDITILTVDPLIRQYAVKCL